MPANVFFDTTILIYSVTEGDARSGTAERLLEAGGIVSVQVLNEFAAVARRKLRMSWKEIEQALGYIRDLCDDPIPITVKTHEAALRIAQRYGFHLYDSLVIASAQEADCAVLYSEDMQHGQRIESLTLRNPFLT